MEAERLRYLEALASSNGGDEFFYNQGIVHWLGRFVDRQGLREDLLSARPAAGPDERSVTSDPYMEPDSEMLAAQGELDANS